MIKVLFFTCEPGGAEVLIPVIQFMLQDNEYQVIVLGYGFAVDRFKKKSIVFEHIEAIEKNDFKLLVQYKPDYIITSATSLPAKDMSEKYLWHNAKIKKIPTMAFLDQWQNYAIRFSGVNAGEELMYQPDYINCINDISKEEMINEGFAEHKLLELGQPYLSELNSHSINSDEILSVLGVDRKKEVVLFVSEAVEEHFGLELGYTQYETLDYIIHNDHFLHDKQLIVKLHPKDDISKYHKYDNVIFIQNELSSLEVISISDYVLGMSSIMLIEAFILNKKVLSVQLNSKEDLLLLSRKNYISCVTNKQHQIKSDNFVRNGEFKYHFDYGKFKETCFANWNL